MTLFALFAPFAAARAGTLDIEVSLGDHTATVSLEGVASCAPFRAEVRGEDFAWEVGGTATSTVAGDLFVELDVLVERAEGRHVRKVRTSPSFLTRPDETARLAIDGEGGPVELSVTGSGFDAREACLPPSQRAEAGAPGSSPRR